MDDLKALSRLAAGAVEHLLRAADPAGERRGGEEARPANVVARNPVMFVVDIGAFVTTLLLVQQLVAGSDQFGFTLQITLWLWFTVLFANFAEAMAEARGKAQADTLRATRKDTAAAPAVRDGQRGD